MDKNTYHRECLFRHPRFRQDLTAFYQRFPCVWRLWPRVKQHPPPDRFREGFHALITAKTDRVLILVPRTIEEVFLLHGATRWLLPAGPEVLFAYQWLTPEWSASYFLDLGSGDTRETHRQALQDLLGRWPTVPRDLLRGRDLAREVRLALLHKPPIINLQREWLEEVTRLAKAREVRGIIPYYETTTLADVRDAFRRLRAEPARWNAVQHRAPRPRRRGRPDQYELRLQVWDAYYNSGAFAPIATALRRRPSTIQGIFLQASRDILGTDARTARSRRPRLLQGVDPATHTQGCPRCQQATTIEELCLPARAYACQDEHGQRELPASD